MEGVRTKLTTNARQNILNEQWEMSVLCMCEWIKNKPHKRANIRGRIVTKLSQSILLRGEKRVREGAVIIINSPPPLYERIRRERNPILLCIITITTVKGEVTRAYPTKRVMGSCQIRVSIVYLPQVYLGIHLLPNPKRRGNCWVLLRCAKSVIGTQRRGFWVRRAGHYTMERQSLTLSAVWKSRETSDQSLCCIDSRKKKRPIVLLMRIGNKFKSATRPFFPATWECREKEVTKQLFPLVKFKEVTSFHSVT